MQNLDNKGFYIELYEYGSAKAKKIFGPTYIDLSNDDSTLRHINLKAGKTFTNLVLDKMLCFSSKPSCKNTTSKFKICRHTNGWKVYEEHYDHIKESFVTVFRICPVHEKCLYENIIDFFKYYKKG